EDDLLEAVICEALGNVEDPLDEVLEMGVDGSGKVHDMAGVAVAVGGKQKHLFGDDRARAACNSGWADDVNVERQVRPVLLDRAAGEHADLAEFDRVVDLGPGEFLVAPLGFCPAGHVGCSVVRMTRTRPTAVRDWHRPRTVDFATWERLGKDSNKGRSSQRNGAEDLR